MKSKTLVALLTLLALFPLFQCKKDKTGVNNSVSSRDFLSSDDYDKLTVEIQYVPGFQPTQATLDNLKALLEQRLNKPAGISFVLTSIASPKRSAYSVSDIQRIESANRTQNTNGKTIAAYFLFIDGDYSLNSGNSKVLGIAYGGSSMVIFEKTIREFSGGITQPSVTTLETTVAEHEFGHILGLVNNGTPMQSPHQDVANGRHCINQNCLMYYNAETSDIVANLLGGGIPSLDTNCSNDLKANGGK
jgi:hypothetical protein